jgi:hypothetical protein
MGENDFAPCQMDGYHPTCKEWRVLDTGGQACFFSVRNPAQVWDWEISLLGRRHSEIYFGPVYVIRQIA